MSILRSVLVVALMIGAVIALRGRVPGVSAVAGERPSALAVAVMPVLLLVSVVILAAGVLISQHRLPLAMPQVEAKGGLPRLRFGRFSVLLPVAVGVSALVFAGGIVALFLLPGARTEQSPPEDAPVRDRPTSLDATAPESPFSTPDLTGLTLVVAVALALLLVALAVVGMAAAFGSARRVPDPVFPVDTELPAPEVDSLTRAAEMGLAAMIAPGQDTREAIIACYVAMERGLSADRAAAPLISDTPNEVLARAFTTGVLQDSSAHELVTLFEEARFSPHAMLGWQRIRAEQSLRAVLADLQRRTAELVA
ncbi:DUF4129 domain-containing protein [Nocardia caishijiensis]|uniref:Uncharacterized protein DUF4129 n=1 Tax=Nocardia caishijiensis TaxID=184756 RepID=A0ABQ6YIJ9_9NOCA|nr:DUF4129 domain-containing protein [Nocardia caishijiensis]KAF0845448.1 uncharacterized protein DUF4129 [Nocardia caishijiensis]